MMKQFGVFMMKQSGIFISIHDEAVWSFHIDS